MRRVTKPPKHADRFIVERGGVYHYKRRVLGGVADIDERAPLVRASVKTRDLAIDRPAYGEGGSLAWRHKAHMRIALPFQPSVV